MGGGDSAEPERGERKMEGEESVNVRTVDCLRGRLLAERMASRNAKEEAEKLGTKMMELEKLLQQEAKSRKRAEKRLKCLMKKLESLNMTYASDESEQSCLVDKSEVASVSSSFASLSTKDPEETSDNHNHQIKVFAKQENSKSTTNLQPIEGSGSSSCSSMETSLQESEMGAHGDPKWPSMSEKSERSVVENAANERFSSFDTHSDKSSQMGFDQSCNYSKIDEHSVNCNDSVRSLREEGSNQDDDEVDNSMALVPVNVPHKLDRIDPQVLDNTVKEVLDALKYAKEQLQNSMERRRRNMIKDVHGVCLRSE